MWNRISYPNERAVRSFALALFTLSCGREARPSADSTLLAPTVAETAVAGGTNACPKSGLWRPCSVLDRLEAAGLVVKPQGDSARFPFFSVAGTTYTTSVSTIHVFLYADHATRERDTDALDSAAVAPRGGTHSWPAPAVLVTSNNLAAVVVSPNERQMERIVLALSAGLPAERH